MNAALHNITPDAAEKASALAEIAEIRARLDLLQNQVLGSMAQPGTALFPREWIDRITDLVAMEWGMSAADLIGTSREQRFTKPRFVWVWLVKHVGNYSDVKCASRVGYADSTSVLHARRRVEMWREANADFRAVTDQLLQIGRVIRAPAAAAPAEEATEEPGQ